MHQLRARLEEEGEKTRKRARLEKQELPDPQMSDLEAALAVSRTSGASAREPAEVTLAGSDLE